MSAVNNDVEGKIDYWGKIGAEVDNRNGGYYHAGIGASRAKNKRFTSVELNLFPTETAPAMNEKIYDLRLNFYTDMYFFKKINATFSFESNYYTNGLLTQQYVDFTPITDPNARPDQFEKGTDGFAKSIYTALEGQNYRIDNYDATADAALTAKFSWDDGEKIKSRFIPFVEGQYSRGTRDLASGYPYWMVRERLYGGGGLAYALNLPNFYTRLEGSYFLDTFSDSFQRYSGTVTYQLWNFSALSATFEFFNQQKYYSNAISFGLKHNFKKKFKKK